MYLISKGTYLADHCPKEDIVIKPYDDSLFTPNCYYFRLGACLEDGKPVPMIEPLTLRAHERRIVFSLETFSLSGRAIAMIGPCSELLLSGVLLHNSPTIDPGFSGSLEMMIENHTEELVILTLGTRIGKAVFFDIGDSAIGLHEYILSEKVKAVRAARRKAGQAIQDAIKWVEKSIDTEGPKDT